MAFCCVWGPKLALDMFQQTFTRVKNGFCKILIIRLDTDVFWGGDDHEHVYDTGMFETRFAVSQSSFSFLHERLEKEVKKVVALK
jgi:hypothetical protein